jgi:uncharacterized protein
MLASGGSAQSNDGTSRSIAVVGAGIAGLSAAWLMSSRHRVTLYEKEPRLGGHAHTVDVESADGPIAVDTGFICYNAPNYPNLTALFSRLGVPTKPASMSFAASVDGGRFEYASSDLNSLVGQRGNLVRPRFWFMLRDMLRFYGDARKMVAREDIGDISLGDYLEREGYSKGLVEDHVLPMCAAIWSTSASEIRNYPLRSYLRFFSNHGLLNITDEQIWRTVDGGSREYVSRMRADFGTNVEVRSGARKVTRVEGGVMVEDVDGNARRFDDVVIAAHADEALAMLGEPDAEQRRLLGAFTYTRNRTILHDDPALMPKRRRVWASWNYIGRRETSDEQPLCVSYWMNKLQSLDKRHPLFVTLNPIREPKAGSVKGEYDYSHPLFNQAAIEAQRDLWSLQGRGGVWFCGSYFGYGFHEDALQSGLAVAEELGNVRRPWTVAEESGRLVLPTRMLLAAE